MGQTIQSRECRIMSAYHWPPTKKYFFDYCRFFELGQHTVTTLPRQSWRKKCSWEAEVEQWVWQWLVFCTVQHLRSALWLNYFLQNKIKFAESPPQQTVDHLLLSQHSVHTEHCAQTADQGFRCTESFWEELLQRFKVKALTANVPTIHKVQEFTLIINYSER